MVWILDGREASSSLVFIIVIILKSLWYRTKYLCTIAYHILGGIMPILWKNGYLVTLRYCEVSVTEFMFVCLFIFFAQVFALFLGYAHALKFSFSNFFIILFVAFTFLLLVGFTHSLSFNSFTWDLCTERGCHMIKRSCSWYSYIKAWNVLFMSDIFWANIQLYLVPIAVVFIWSQCNKFGI